MKDLVEIVEYWDRKVPVYEIMLGSEFKKKLVREDYEVLHRGNLIPFIEFGNDDNWKAQKTWIKEEEFKDRFLTTQTNIKTYLDEY